MIEVSSNRLVPLVDKSERVLNDIVKMYDDIDTLLVNKEYNLVDSLLTAMQVSIQLQPTEYLIALIRKTCPAKRLLIKWVSLRNSILEELTRRNLDAKKIMKGLFEDDRTHEECCDCALEEVEPSQCAGHPSGPVSCHFFVEKN